MVILVWLLAFATPGIPELARTPDVSVLVSFDHELAWRTKRQFEAVLTEPESSTGLKPQWVLLPQPRGTKDGYLALPYELSRMGQTRWFLKLGGSDWSRYGELVVLLRWLEPEEDDSSTGEVPSRLFLEITSSSGAVKVPISHSVIQEQEGVSSGHFAMRVSLPELGIDLKQVNGIALLIEHECAGKTELRGAVGIHAVVLTTSAGYPVERALRAPDRLVEDLNHGVFSWVQKYRHPRTGLVLDRAPEDPSFVARPEEKRMASIAAVGFALSLLPEWVRLGYLGRSEAIQQAESTLRFFLERATHRHGIFAHFYDWSGTPWGWRQDRPFGKSEYSTTDSAILLCGVACVSQALGGEITRMADCLLDRVEWPRFVIDGRKPGQQLLSLGWRPERGLLGGADVRSSEYFLIYALAAASRTHPVDLWHHSRVEFGEVAGRKVLNPHHPLFTSYFGVLFWDLDGLVDKDGIDLWTNAMEAALANRAFCREQGERLTTYAMSTGGWWGISAGDAPENRYLAPGCMPGDAERIVWPTAALPTIQWIPREVKEDLVSWRKSQAWHLVSGQHGLRPFRLGEKEWVAKDLLGIDLLSAAAGIANHRNRTILAIFQRHWVYRAAIERLGLTKRANRRTRSRVSLRGSLSSRLERRIVVQCPVRSRREACTRLMGI